MMSRYDDGHKANSGRIQEISMMMLCSTVTSPTGDMLHRNSMFGRLTCLLLKARSLKNPVAINLRVTLHMFQVEMGSLHKSVDLCPVIVRHVDIDRLNDNTGLRCSCRGSEMRQTTQRPRVVLLRLDVSVIHKN